MKNNTLTLATIFGASGVALGALGAHFLKNKMQEGLINADQLAGFDTATKYQLFHSILLLIIYLMNKEGTIKLLNGAANLIVFGILFFSGSIYFLTTKNLMGIENLKFLGPITPIGGLLLIAGWICLFIHSIKKNKI